MKQKKDKVDPDTTQKSVEDGKKMIEVQKKLTLGSVGKKEQEEKKDAEKWRNEG